MRTQPWMLLAAILPFLPVASGQDTPEEAPERRVTEPGRGPQIPFDEARWEFWFYFNREALLRLRPALLQMADGGGDVDVPFEKVTAKDREESLIPRLISGLRDDNPRVRFSAVQALAKTRDPAARPLLFGALRDSQFEVRLSAIVALGVYGNTISIPRLEEIIKADDRELQERFYAAVALGSIGGPQVTASLRSFLAPKTFNAFPVLVQAGLAYGVGLSRSPENAPLIRALLDAKPEDFVVSAYLILSLGKCGTDEDVSRLIALLENQETQFRRSAAIALGALLREAASDNAVAALAKVSRGDPDVMVKNFAYLSIGSIGGAQARRELANDFTKVTKAYRPFVALALGMIGDPESVPPLLAAFDAESDTSLRGAIAIALGLHRDARAAPALRKLFRQTGEPVLRGYLALALGMIGDVEAIEDLRKVFDNATDVELIVNAAIALGLLGDRAGAERLAKRAHREENEFVKQSLIYGLGLVGDRSAIAALSTMIEKDRDVAYVRAYAVTALGLLADSHDVRAIARVSRDSNYTIPSSFLNDLFTIL